MKDQPYVELDRRSAVAFGAASALVLVVLALWLVPWEWVPGGRLRPMPASNLFTDAEIARAEEYARLRRLVSWLSYGVSFSLAMVLGFTSLGARLVRRVAGRLPWFLTAAVGVLLLLVVGRVATLPFALLLRRQRLEYDLTRQALGGWVRDQVTSLLVAWVIAALLVLVVLAMARLSPRRWFLGAGGVIVGLSMLGSFVYPVVVEPLFNNFTPMAPGELRSQVLRLAEREGVVIEDVLIADASRRTTTLNAYVSGLGSTRRIVVYDNLIDQLSTEEAALVVAHELAHAKHQDVLVGTGLSAAGGVVGVALLALLLDSRSMRRRAGVAGAADPAAVALMLALVSLGTFAASPVANAVSRAVEVRADREALRSADEAGRVFVRMQRRLALESLSDPTPPRLSQIWFGSHPTVLERAGLPQSLREADR